MKVKTSNAYQGKDEPDLSVLPINRIMGKESEFIATFCLKCLKPNVPAGKPHECGGVVLVIQRKYKTGSLEEMHDATQAVYDEIRKIEQDKVYLEKLRKENPEPKKKAKAKKGKKNGRN